MDRTEIYIILAGEINAESVKRLSVAIFDPQFVSAQDVHLQVHSNGGMISDGIAMYNLLQGIPQNLITYNIGDVSSIAVLPYLAGETRRASKSSLFMIHKALGGMPPGNKVEAFQSAIDLFKINNNRIETIIGSKVSLTKAQRKIHADRDLYISATDAVRCRSGRP